MGGPDAEDLGPPSAGVAHINAHGKKAFGGCLSCSWLENKGRVVYARKVFKEGEIILAEAPCHIVQEDPKSAAWRKLKSLCKSRDDDFDYEPLWYWCALQSLTKDALTGAKAAGMTGASDETQQNLLLLHHEDIDEPSKAAEILVQELVPGADAVTLERLIQIWVLNCFEYSDAPQGYSTYFFSSFMSHSCFPNAVWHYTGTDHVLRARRDIHLGDEVCISYLPESSLLQSAPVRRMELHDTKRFWCTCERCVAGVMDYSRGFSCPNCKEGIVFAKTPVAGPAKDASLLVSQIQGASCNKCSHSIAKAEATKLSGLERKLQQMVDDLTKRAEGPAARQPDVKELQASESFIDSNFSQHVLTDLAWQPLAELYGAKRKLPDQRRLLERRCAFHKAAYPGLSGAHAWALEALGDAMKGVAADSADEKASKKGKPGEASLRLYGESLDILRLMFGEDHEYVTDVEQKRKALESA